jgi:CubicO group peptidase (beta-lactamase class C family)
MRSLLLLSLLPGALAQAPCYDLSAIDGIAQTAITNLQLPGIVAQVNQRGGVLHQRAYGGYQLASVVSIASVSKTLAATILLAQVDQGRCRLDDRVSTYIASFQRSDKVAITLRHCFTHTSGLLANHPIMLNDGSTLALAADVIAGLPMQFTPGTEFEYGQLGMHTAARVCEIVSGRTWAQLVSDVLVTQLAMTSTDFGATANPFIAGGARSNVPDLINLFEMLRQRGRFRTQRVLSEAAVDEMVRAQTIGLPVRSTPHPFNAPYGIGIWVERFDAQGRTVQASAAGGLGFDAWLDREREVTGALMTVDRFPAMWPYWDEIQQLTRAMLAPVGVLCVGAASPTCAPPTYLNGDRMPRAGDAQFGLIATRAPANSAGVLALAARARLTPLPILGIALHLELLPPPVLVPWSSDALGAARLPLSLAGIVEGERAAAQALWLTLGGCGGDLRASPAVALEVQAR